MYVIVRFLDERDRGEAEVEFIQKTCYNLVTTWLLYLRGKKFPGALEVFYFRENVFFVLLQPPDNNGVIPTQQRYYFFSSFITNNYDEIKLTHNKHLTTLLNKNLFY